MKEKEKREEKERKIEEYRKLVYELKKEDLLELCEVINKRFQEEFGRQFRID